MGKIIKIPFTQKELKEMFYYDGRHLLWQNQKANCIKIGVIAGTIDYKGYRRIQLNKKVYKAHRLIWVYYYGSIDSTLQIDHINEIKDDNRIENLRLATNQTNQWNRKKVKGYTWAKDRKKWRARIGLNSKHIRLGSFKTELEARHAYLKAKEKYHKVKC